MALAYFSYSPLVLSLIFPVFSHTPCDGGYGDDERYGEQERTTVS